MNKYLATALLGGVSIVVLSGLSAEAGALPSHGHFVSGQGSIAKGNQSLTVKQSSTTGIIDWNGFSVGKHQGVTFDNGSGATLNRVTGGNLSTIAGTLHATGSLYLLNSSGVIVSGTGHVITGGNFVASSGNLTDNAFNADDRRLFNAKAGVINRGDIAAGGGVSLIGHDAINTGTIRAAYANLYGRGGNATDTGTIDATGNARHNAHILMIATDGKTEVAGSLVARNANGTGGLIETSGHEVSIGGRIDAGKGGTWLVDPFDLTIDSAAAATIDSSLADDTDVELQTTSSGASGPGIQNAAGNGDIIIDSALNWSTSATLTMSAYRNIDINAKIKISGNGTLVLDDNTSGGGGDYFISNGASIDFGATDNGGALTIDTTAYQLIYNATDLEGINSNLSGQYALATSFDASDAGNWTPIASACCDNFSGTFAGLGHTISNLTINQSSSNEVGLFAEISGTVRDVGLLGVSVTGNDEVGGLVGYNNGGTITNSYVTGSVRGNEYNGGLVGESFDGTITGSFSTAEVSGGGPMGGLVGYTDDGAIANSFATGPVVATSDGTSNTVGGFVGDSFGTALTNVFATGYVKGEQFDTVGGLVGNSDATIQNGYWDTQTSGTDTGLGNNDNSQSVTPMSTAQLQGKLPTGFDTTAWKTGTGLFPYLTWQFSGTPQSVTGFVYSDASITALAAGEVSLLVNGTNLGTVSTGANGYYYFAVAPKSVPSSNGQVFVFDAATDQASFEDNANGSVSGLNLIGGYLSEFSKQTSYKNIQKDLATALGGASFTTPNLFVDAKGSDLDIDQSINVSGTVDIDAAGAIDQTAGKIVAHALTGQSDGTALFDSSNQIDSLASFSTGGNFQFQLDDDSALAVSGVVNAGSRQIKLVTTGGGHSIAVNGTLEGSDVQLTSSGSITENSSGVIDTDDLTGSAAGSVAMQSDGNVVTDLGTFSSGGAFGFTDDHNLATTGKIDTGTKGLTLTTKGKGHTITISSVISGGEVKLVSASSIVEKGAGTIAAATLSGSSASKVSLNGSNVITALGAFTSGNTFSLVDTHALAITGAVSGGSNQITLTTTGSGHGIAVNGKIKAASLQLVSASGISETKAGSIQAADFAGSSAGTVALTSHSNIITHLGSFSTGSHAFSLFDDRSLSVEGTVDAGSSTLALTTIGHDSNLDIDGTLTGGTISLVTTGKADESAQGAIEANTLNVTASTGIELTSEHNQIKAIGKDTTKSGPNKITK